MTFAASVNCVLYCDGTPVFADVEAETLLIDPRQVQERVTEKTRAIIAVDYAGQPCDYDALRDIADRHGLVLVSDACHSLGGAYRERKVGTLADITAFSFHPVKHVTTGEGGMVPEERKEADILIAQYASGRFGVNEQYFKLKIFFANYLYSILF